MRSMALRTRARRETRRRNQEPEPDNAVSSCQQLGVMQAVTLRTLGPTQLGGETGQLWLRARRPRCGRRTRSEQLRLSLPNGWPLSCGRARTTLHQPPAPCPKNRPGERRLTAACTADRGRQLQRQVGLRACDATHLLVNARPRSQGTRDDAIDGPADSSAPGDPATQPGAGARQRRVFVPAARRNASSDAANSRPDPARRRDWPAMATGSPTEVRSENEKRAAQTLAAQLLLASKSAPFCAVDSLRSRAIRW
jgi:hypothetical protein